MFRNKKTGNITMSNNIIGNSVTYKNGKIVSNNVNINGQPYDLDELPNSSSGVNISVINERVYVNGYELIDGKWKKTLRSIFHYFF